jgi:hypothetical protein
VPELFHDYHERAMPDTVVAASPAARTRIELPAARRQSLRAAILLYQGEHGAPPHATLHRVSGAGQPLVLAGRSPGRGAALALARSLGKTWAPVFCRPMCCAAIRAACCGGARRAGATSGSGSTPSTRPRSAAPSAPPCWPSRARARPARRRLAGVCAARRVRCRPRRARAPRISMCTMMAPSAAVTSPCRARAVAQIRAWTDAFFNSWFTHPALGGAERERLYALWRGLLDAPGRRFPLRALAPAGLTLGQLIDAGAGHLGLGRARRQS